MPSEYTVKIKVDPFVQRILYKTWGDQNTSKPLRIPARDNLAVVLVNELMKQPKDYPDEDYGDWTLEVYIPYMEYKDPSVYNYLSKKRQKSINRDFKAMVYALFNREFTFLRRNTRKIKDEIIDFMEEEYGFSSLEDRDRLIKEYDRWVWRLASGKYRKKKKMKKNT